jgi:GNAT superfamily N-acetyltransferase
MRPVLHDIAILAAPATAHAQVPAAAAAPLTLHALREPAAIHAALAAVEHRIRDARLAQRLRNGLWLARFDADGVPVATTWLADGASGRYVDELNWLLPMALRDLWLRDVFVAPAWRRRGLFVQMVAALRQWDGGGDRCIWSDVDWDNGPSMRAHEAAGFRVVVRAKALDLFGRLRIRSALPPWPLPVTEIDPGARWVWLHGATRARHQALIA